MRLSIVAIIFCFSIAQDYGHIKAQINDRTISVLKGKRDTTITVYLDGYELNENNIKQVGKSLIVNKIIQSNNVIYIKSKFTYLINDKVYKRNRKLKSLISYKIVSFDVYSRNEAYEIFGIKARNGLIRILYEDG